MQHSSGWLVVGSGCLAGSRLEALGYQCVQLRSNYRMREQLGKSEIERQAQTKQVEIERIRSRTM